MALTRENTEDIMDLSPTQEGLLFHYVKDKDSKDYYEQLCIRLRGDVRLELVQQSWDLLIANHAALRTVFKWEKINKPVQIVLKSYKVKVNYSDLSSYTEDEKLQTKNRLKHKDLNHIDITEDTLKITLLKLEDEYYELVISNHHILYDGWSNGIILGDFMSIYNSLHKGVSPEIPVSKSNFKDYIKWSKSVDFAEHKEYWSNYLSNTDVNYDVFDYNGDTHIKKQQVKKLSKELSRNLHHLAKRNNISLASILYTAWGILLQRLNNSDDAVFGTTVSGRTAHLRDIDHIVGLFINTVPLRVKCEKNHSIQDLINQVNDELKYRGDYENTPLVKVQEFSGEGNSKNLFNTLVVIENYPLDFGLNDTSVIKLEDYTIEEQTNYNLTLTITAFDDLALQFTYINGISDELVKRLPDYLENILATFIAEKKDTTVGAIDFLGLEEEQRVLNIFNHKPIAFSEDQSLQSLIEDQVFRTPDLKAVVYKGQALTYRDLNSKANALAQWLRHHDVKPNSIVAIIVEPSIEMIVGILAILKAGGAYCPIDPTLPQQRIQDMLEDCGTKLVLSQPSLIDDIHFKGVIVDLNERSIYEYEIDNLENVNGSDDLAYIIYTSGTTGKPKGVMIEHRSAISFILAVSKVIDFEEAKSILSVTSLSFDIFFLENILPLTKGMSVVICEKQDQNNAEKLCEFIADHNIDIIQTTPSRMKLLINNPNSLSCLNYVKQILLGGEALQEELILHLSKLQFTKIYNMYGPTEATVWSSVKEITSGQKITIGKPLCNSQMYILDKDLHLQPIGIPGELFIAGTGLARGYKNRPQLTKEKFINHPFSGGAKLYRTGDLAKWTEQGEIEYIGRSDFQVKIRGHRIEIGEIEYRLLQHEEIQDAVVLDKEDELGNKYLNAFIVCNRDLTVKEIRSFLSEKLPDYMLPSQYVQLAEMPLNSNGKLNRNTLIGMSSNVQSGSNYVAPTHETEEKLVSIWMNLLETECIGIDDDFFMMGGNSLTALRLVTSIHKEFKVNIPVQKIFENPTIKGIADYISHQSISGYESIGKVSEKIWYETSSAQKRMYILQKMEQEEVAYNIFDALLISGNLDVTRLDLAFKQLIERQESLRTSFEIADDQLVQKIHESIEFSIERLDEQDIDVRKTIQYFNLMFDLGRAPLLRVGLIKLGVEEHLLLFNMHHIISDGSSIEILKRELITLYKGSKLEKLEIQYKDYSEWHNRFLTSPEMKRQENYWLARFKGFIPSEDLMRDKDAPKGGKLDGARIAKDLDQELFNKVNDLAYITKSTVFMVFLSVLTILISKYTGEEDVVIGTPIAGRTHTDTENMIGMFVNTLPMRNQVDMNKTYITFLADVKSNALSAYQNKDYPFTDLVQKLGLKRVTGRNPLFNISFFMHNSKNDEIKIEHLHFEKYKDIDFISKFDITVGIIEMDKGCKVEFEYSKNLNNEKTISVMIDNFIHILKEVLNDEAINLDEINIYSKYKNVNADLLTMDQNDFDFSC